MKADPFHVREETQDKETQRRHPAKQSEIPPLRQLIRLVAESAHEYLDQREEQQRRDQGRLHHEEPPAIALE